ncbi:MULTISPECIES: helix-turn-helix domain-containing protein [Olivibacter]|jgi:AraC-like DNA-binding protein|uniref:Helix-turn-helix domain-containing protein n=1 Tax=Olivibacter oleidegradans TaxID=760123 RepID=A0ABV6HMZ1_9SPHI|nr:MULTISPECIES: helix-turn-helix domain-containing protein [Olivibacter]MCL4641985.1 helix-turn-helix domain-containing protein [Olivibacter sp. UJ_SKK_5.1]MDM8173181.1 helix-turn-helix domain-containing protein [Olivibacter sp. 47]MDX3915360.1 helix-turn-helix domain-containing protein [Pseudosphingobacterium sp.]QEL02979.1 helix-turn-helix domain-containing protein [Olivibacter sp. LS-1]
MNKQEVATVNIRSLAQQHQLLGLAKPKHPLFSLLRFEDFPKNEVEQRTKLVSDLYQITLKKDCPCKTQYGQTQYDFDEGVMSFFSPKQVNILEVGNFIPQTGWLLSVHPDFLRGYPLSQKTKTYDFFHYAVNEALILSDEEQKSIEAIFLQIEKETSLPIDKFSQDVIISNIDLLLTYCNRYYHRQFITRKQNSSELLSKFESLLNAYFTETENGLPTVNYFASKLNLSPKYLSDCLKQLTGQTAQQHIHDKLIENAKEKLTSTGLSVSEIAYQLGFDYPQSFSKLFKQKTEMSPLAFRQNFN